MQDAFRAHEIEARSLHLRLDTKGARVLRRRDMNPKRGFLPVLQINF